MTVWSRIRESVIGKRNALSLGQRGERAAERFLSRRGFKIVARGYSNHVGEIDLIGIDVRSKPRTVVFVEVKTRQTDLRGLPVEAVDERKQRQITETAMVYLRQHHLLENRFRFDIIGIMWPEETRRPEINHYMNAFEPTGRGQLFA
ncbi:MAG: YraN family protein [Pirellulaceae bacterium]